MLYEHALCLRWSQRRFGVWPLRTADGHPLAVVYPGRWCRTPGPDFRDAVLLLDNDLQRGDVEVHTRASGWWGHGHDRQPTYNRVILQVVLDVDRPEPPRREDGYPVPTLQLPLLVDDLGVVAPPTCPEAAQRWGAASLPPLLETLGMERVLERASRMEADMTVQPSEQVLYEALAAALGYRHNAASLQELAGRLPLGVLEALAGGQPSPTRLFDLSALLLGTAGLLPGQRAAGGGHDGGPAGPIFGGCGYRFSLEASWARLEGGHGLEPMRRSDWRFAQVRPENWPPRRVVALAWLLDRHCRAGLLPAICEAARSGPAALVAALAGGAEVEYWSTHYDFGRAKRPTQLVGPRRAGELAVNAALPFAYAYGQREGDQALSDAALRTLRAFPTADDNELTRYMRREVLHLAGVQGACRQQGLLHLYHRWCRDKDCSECPVAAGPG